MTVIATYPDVERAAIGLLEAAIAVHYPAVTIGVGVPTGWKPSSPPHVSVAVDGAFMRDHPVAGRYTVRFTVRAGTTTAAKEIANAVFALACGHDGTGDISAIRPAAGVIADRDPDTKAELASCSVTAVVRSKPL